MASILPAVLLVLFLQYAPTYSSTEPCVIANAMMGGDFNFTIYPMNYMTYTHYNVTVSGFGENATIVLSSYFNGSAAGMWINNATDCDGFKGNSSTYVMTQWVSPFVISDYVKIRAFVYTMNGTYVKNITLMQIDGNTSTTTGTTMATTVTTTNSASGFSSKPLQAFVCMLLLLVTVPGL